MTASTTLSNNVTSMSTGQSVCKRSPNRSSSPFHFTSMKPPHVVATGIIIIPLLFASTQLASGAARFDTQLRCDSTFTPKFGNFTTKCSAQQGSFVWNLRQHLPGLVINGSIAIRSHLSGAYVRKVQPTFDYCQMLAGRKYVDFVSIIVRTILDSPNEHLVDRCPIKPVGELLHTTYM